jgi:phosphatidate cytidylyltransferase
MIIVSLLIHKFLFFSLFLFFSIFCLWEFYQLTKHIQVKPQIYSGLFISVTAFLYSFLDASGDLSWPMYLIPVLMVFFVPVIELYRNTANPLTNIAATFFGIIYTGLPFVLMNYLVFFNSSFFDGRILLGIFILIWGADSAAYLFGTRLGRNRLFERISPKKSWEGFIGGLITALLLSVLLAQFIEKLDLLQWLIIALITSIAGMYGDLTESMFKRHIKVKDSGIFLPGHGGILDRLDSLILSVIPIFIYLHLIAFL